MRFCRGGAANRGCRPLSDEPAESRLRARLPAPPNLETFVSTAPPSPCVSAPPRQNDSLAPCAIIPTGNTSLVHLSNLPLGPPHTPAGPRLDSPLRRTRRHYPIPRRLRHRPARRAHHRPGPRAKNSRARLHQRPHDLDRPQARPLLPSHRVHRRDPEQLLGASHAPRGLRRDHVRPRRDPHLHHPLRLRLRLLLTLPRLEPGHAGLARDRHPHATHALLLPISPTCSPPTSANRAPNTGAPPSSSPTPTSRCWRPKRPCAGRTDWPRWDS